MSYGLLAFFPDPETLSDAARAMHERGYRRMDAFSPFPVHDLARALGFRRTRLPWLVLAGALAGAAAAYGLITYSVLVDYPINVGGRPLHSWPPFVVLAFEGGILGGALAAFFGTLWANRLPEYYHPVFNSPRFTFAGGGVFCLLVEASDDQFDRPATEQAMLALGARTVEEVDP